MFRFLTLTFFTPELGCRSGQFLTGSESRILIKKTRINFILPFNEVLHVNDVIQNLLTFTLYKYKDLDPQKFNFREKQDFHKFIFVKNKISINLGRGGIFSEKKIDP